MLISFSGIDCGGKSTQIENVRNTLITSGHKCKIIHSRGGYTPCLEFFKTIIRKDKFGNKDDHEMYRNKIHSNVRKRKLLLWFSIFDLAIFYGIYFRALELFGYTILADRYFWDSYIDFKMKYSEYNFKDWNVWKFAKKIYLKPKYSIIYVIPAEISMYRSSLKYEPWPESVDIRRIRISKYEEEIRNGRWKYCVDATTSISEVFENTMRIIEGE